MNRKFPHAVIEALNSKLVNTTFNVRLEVSTRNIDFNCSCLTNMFVFISMRDIFNSVFTLIDFYVFFMT